MRLVGVFGEEEQVGLGDIERKLDPWEEKKQLGLHDMERHLGLWKEEQLDLGDI